MSFDKVKEFIELAKSSGVSELKFESGDDKFYVKVQSDQPVMMSAPAVTHGTVAHSMASIDMGTSDDKDNAVKPGLVNITSPFVGTFYRSSSPDSGPYVKIGDKVSKGQPLCIVEAMKIMNEIESEADGEIAEICVENETYVEFGQVLFRVKA